MGMASHVHNLKHLKEPRKELRNGLTPEEAILWNRLKDSGLGYKFRRQHSTRRFILDFYCPKKFLAIELDGSQHLDTKEYDEERTRYLNSLNIRVIRFWNSEVNTDIEVVLSKIKEELESPSPTPLLS